MTNPTVQLHAREGDRTPMPSYGRQILSHAPLTASPSHIEGSDPTGAAPPCTGLHRIAPAVQLPRQHPDFAELESAAQPHRHSVVLP